MFSRAQKGAVRKMERPGPRWLFPQGLTDVGSCWGAQVPGRALSTGHPAVPCTLLTSRPPHPDPGRAPDLDSEARGAGPGPTLPGSSPPPADTPAPRGSPPTHPGAPQNLALPCLRAHSPPQPQCPHWHYVDATPALPKVAQSWGHSQVESGLCNHGPGYLSPRGVAQHAECTDAHPFASAPCTQGSSGCSLGALCPPSSSPSPPPGQRLCRDLGSKGQASGLPAVKA